MQSVNMPPIGTGLLGSGLGLNFTIRRHIIIEIESNFCGYEDAENIWMNRNVFGNAFVLLLKEAWSLMIITTCWSFLQTMLWGLEWTRKESFDVKRICRRFGDDEFCVFYTGNNSDEILFQKAQQICEVIKNIRFGNDGEEGCSVSIGIARRTEADDFTIYQEN